MSEKEIIERLVAVEQRSKSNTKRLDEKDSKDAEQDKKIIELSDVYIALTKVNDKVDKIEDNVTEMKSDIKEIKEKPIKRLDLIWGYAMSVLIGSILTSILQIFMK